MKNIRVLPAEICHEDEISADEIIGKTVTWRDRFSPYTEHSGECISYEGYDSDEELGIELLHVRTEEGNVKKVRTSRIVSY
jgi:hypothetical protein